MQLPFIHVKMYVSNTCNLSTSSFPLIDASRSLGKAYTQYLNILKDNLIHVYTNIHFFKYLKQNYERLPCFWLSLRLLYKILNEAL